MTPPTITFESACEDALNDLRAALVVLYDSVGADPLSAQDVSRRFKLNKTLTWNVSRLIQSSGGLAAVSHVPGRAALEKMLDATRKAGASDEAVARVRDAATAFEEVVQTHVGDRTTLDLVLDGVLTPTSAGLERSRKLAFRGNSGLYGVQARAKLLTAFLYPNADDPDRLDMAMIAGYAGFRRLRGDVRWPIFTPRAWTNTDEPIAEQWRPIMNGTPKELGDLSLMHEFSQGSLPEMETVNSAEGCDVMLKPGAIGNPGAFDCYRGDYMRSAAGRYRTEDDETGEFGASITTPSEYLVADLVVHEDLEFALRPEVLVFGRFYQHGEPSGGADDRFVLPIRQKVTALPGSPPAVATPLVPRYADMVNTVYERLEWDPKRFRAVRLQMSDPPFGSTVILRFELPARPAD